ncbi:kinesin-like protein KIF17 [Trichonephila clavipes]|nr:kinesin-like protein KIF17 [Trichonephila clavipes]
MVGGEKAHDRELKEKRAKRKNVAEKRIKSIAEALSKVDEDDKAMLKVYDDIHEELRAKTQLLKKAKKKIQALDREVRDLQSEFETERTDYLETIRKQDQQIKLLTQILDKIQPCIRRDCNYSNIEKIKSESYWDEDYQKWRIPELIVQKTKLPTPGVQIGGRPAVSPVHRIKHNRSASSVKEYFEDSSEDKFFRKLERGEEEDIAGTYFKPRRQEQLLSKFKETAYRVGCLKLVSSTMTTRSTKSGLQAVESIPNMWYCLKEANKEALSMSNGSIPSLVKENNALNSLNSSLLNGNLNGSMNGGTTLLIQPSSQESTLNHRKPTKLEALPNGGDLYKRGTYLMYLTFTPRSGLGNVAVSHKFLACGLSPRVTEDLPCRRAEAH